MMPAERQATDTVLMVRPRRFAANPQTAPSNAFQQRGADTCGDVAGCAGREFERLRQRLVDAGISVIVFDDTAEPAKPDAVFPNNWVSFHADGTVILYPLEAPNRRPERRTDIIAALSERHGVPVSRIVDLSPLETRGFYLEGTGSLVLDRVNRIAYAALSSRTHPQALADFSQQAGYEAVAFDTADDDGRPVYHTNVMMSIGTHFVVLCPQAIRDSRQRRAVLTRLSGTGRDIVTITIDQMRLFAGNLIELATVHDDTVIALSQMALAALQPDQLTALERHGRLLDVDVGTIERLGGGSVRCMIAAIHRAAPADNPLPPG